MKQRFTLMALAAMAALSAGAFTVGGMNYNIVGDGEVEIARPADTSEDGAYTDVNSFPSTVTYGGTTYTVVGIGTRAFQYAEIVGAPAMPSSYRYVGDFAFFEVQPGGNLKIGVNVDSIGMGAFAGNAFSNFLCDLDNQHFSLIYSADLEEGETFVGGVLATKDKQTIIAYPGGKKESTNGPYVYTYTVPRCVKHIRAHAFNRTPNLRQVIFHDGVEDIGDYAFYECPNLVKVEIPGGTKLGYGSYAANEFKLQQIILHEGITEVPAYCFFDAAACTDLQLPSTLKYVYEGAFSNLEALTTLNLPEGFIACDKNAFANLTSMTELNINDACEYLGVGAFLRCTALTDVDLKNVQYLDNTAFNNCTALKHVKASGLVAIGNAPFYCCFALETVEFPETLREIGPVCFMRCTSLNSAVIPAGVETVGDGYAAGATALTAIEVAEGNTHYTAVDGILYTADMTRLVSLPGSLVNTEVTLPATVEIIGNQSCRWSNITKLVAPGVKTILQTALGECTALTELTLGAQCDSIGTYALNSCTALTAVTSLNNVPPMGGVFADGVYAEATLYVPAGAMEAYQADENWGKFVNIVELGENPGLPGDMNGDGVIDVDDVNIIINAILADEAIEGGDISGDGQMDIDDVNALINLILSN